MCIRFLKNIVDSSLDLENPIYMSLLIDSPKEIMFALVKL